VRGQQSAALVVDDVALRVEDHAAPLVELRRLLGLHRAYGAAGAGDEAMAEGRLADAGALYEEAARLAPDNAELLFWSGLSATRRGERDEGLDRVRRAIAANPGLGVLLDRLTEDIAPGAADVRAAL
jgi:tetratricopeptide (TPR) repeat protein